MEALFHLLFEIVKISVLACIYSTIALILWRYVGRKKPGSWFDKISVRQGNFWFWAGFVISVGLFVFMFSYFGDHGLGDHSRVPIGHGKAIEQINGTYSYIQSEGPISALSIDSFIVTNDFVYGYVGELNENYEGRYFIYELARNQVEMFYEWNHFSAVLKEKGLGEDVEYKNFDYYYREYWSGFRFWFLP